MSQVRSFTLRAKDQVGRSFDMIGPDIDRVIAEKIQAFEVELGMKHTSLAVVPEPAFYASHGQTVQFLENGLVIALHCYITF